MAARDPVNDEVSSIVTTSQNIFNSSSSLETKTTEVINTDTKTL